MWEHRSDFPFRADAWLIVESKLRASGKRGLLLLDDCPEFLRQVNLLADGLAAVENPALSIVLTANAAHWVPRKKSPALYSRGTEIRIEQLSEFEINGLLSLLAQQPSIRELVDKSFSQLGRDRQYKQLKSRCSSEMFVCLKNIFATDQLDMILLREFAQLEEPLQDIYRHVSALEAAGVRVHRQLVIRILSVAADKVAALLSLLDGLIVEYDIKPDDGLYGWSTRHLVIAQTISKYKFSNQDEFFQLIVRVIEGANPAVPIELRMLRNLCDAEWGIGRLNDDARQIELYEKLIKTVPAERIPRHRLINKLLRLEQYEAAGHCVRDAEEAVGLDSPISRYRVQVIVGRASTSSGILDEDRIAMLREAWRLAIKGAKSFPDDKHAYSTLCDVALELSTKAKDVAPIEEALVMTRDAANRILDPWLFDFLRKFESEVKRLIPQAG